jgi:hypothetical protein
MKPNRNTLRRTLWREAQRFEMRQISPERRLHGARFTPGIKMIVERTTDTVSRSIETTAASFPRSSEPYRGPDEK